MLQVESSEAPVPFVPPRLVNLKLHGIAECISEFINLIDMSSPLHNVIFHFHYPYDQNVPALIGAVKKILAVYYECGGLCHPRKANRITISSSSTGNLDPLVFAVQSHSGPASTPRPILELQFGRTDEVSETILPLFPLNDVQEFTAEGLELSSNGYYTVLREMKNLLHLRLSKLQVGPVLDAFRSCEQGVSKAATEPSR